MKITVKNGKGRPVNLGKFYSPQWASFESTVEWHDCPEATEDGEYTAELVWQIKINDQWYFSVEPTADAGSRYRQVWRIVPQPQKIDFCDTCDFPIKPKHEGDKYICHCKTGYSKPQLTDTNVAQSKENEDAKTVEGKTAEDVEEIASKVHDAWWEEKKSNGFHSPNDCQSKNKESYSKSSWQNQDRFDTHFDSKTYKWCDKCHPDMYPYNELTENAKEYDRTTVTTVLKAMQAYSSQQNKALMEENERLKKSIIDALELMLYNHDKEACKILEEALKQTT